MLMMNNNPPVLIADDNDVDRMILKAIVSKAGYQIVEARDGIEALSLFHEVRPNIVLLDALMPGLDGFEVAEKIKSEPSAESVSIVFLTSLTEAVELARCVSSGGDDFLSKPYNEVILHAKLQSLQRVQDLHERLGEQRAELERHNQHLIHEQEAAKAVFDSIALRGQLDAPYLQHLISPMSVFNGDVLLVAPTPRNTQHLLLGDFTGHGLTAAIGAVPLAEVFYGMSQKGFTLRDIVKECNRKLHSILPVGYFCCAIIVDINFAKQTVEYWNGGLPDGYLVNATSDDFTRITSASVPLGILATSDIRSDTTMLTYELGQRLVFCTDGILEAENQSGEPFGEDRFQKHMLASKKDCVAQVQRATGTHLGEQARSDDFTMVEVNLVAADQVELNYVDDATYDEVGADQWSIAYELCNESLSQFNPLPMLMNLLLQCPGLRSRSGDIHVVLSELYSNALEHGVLNLDSGLKNTAQGFAQYYAERAKALQGVTGKVRIEFDCGVEGSSGLLRIRVTDSGSGFDFQRSLDRARALWHQDSPGQADIDNAYHGRGVGLLLKLCDNIAYVGKGNVIEVDMQWEAAA